MKKLIVISVIVVVCIGLGFWPKKAVTQPVPTNLWLFTQLRDTPQTLSSQGGKLVAVNSGATALEFNAGTTSITTLGTVTTGTWQATDIGVAYGGTGVSTLTDGGVLLGSGAGAITAMGVLANGSIIVGDGATDPVALAVFTNSTGDLIHEAGGLEADVSGYANGIYGMAGGATLDIDTEAELETALGGLDIITVTSDDVSSANMITAVSDETGSGLLVFSASPTFNSATFTGLVDTTGAVLKVADPIELEDAVNYDTLLDHIGVILDYWISNQTLTTTLTSSEAVLNETPTADPQILSTITFKSTVADTPAPFTLKEGSIVQLHYSAYVTTTAGKRTEQLAFQLGYVDSDGTGNFTQIGATSTYSATLTAATTTYESHIHVESDITVPSGKRLWLKVIADATGATAYPEISFNYDTSIHHIAFGVVGSVLGNYLTSAQIDTSSELAAIIGDETGTGLIVFSATPTFNSASFTGAVDMSLVSSLVMPSSATPTTAVTAEIELDTSITDHQPLWQYYDGGENMTIIAIDTAQLPALDNEIIGYDAATDKWILEAPGANHNVASHSDTSATGTELDTLTDNSIADTLHRHTELVASDGTPDPALSVDSVGRVGMGTSAPDGSLEIRTGNSVIRIRDTGDTATATTSFVEFGGTTTGSWNRTGYVGDWTTEDMNIALCAEDGDLVLGDSSSFNVLTLSGGDVTATGALEAATLTEGGNAVPNATDHLGFFGGTTSAQLLAEMSDETGTGLLVFSATPTFNSATFTGRVDMSTASSFVIPNGTDPDVDTAGEISHDTDDEALRGYGFGTQFVFAQATKTIQFTIMQPDDLDEADDIPVWSNDSGFTFYITEIKGWADADNADFALVVASPTNFTAETTIESITLTTDGTGVYYDTILAANIDHAIVVDGDMIIFDPSADDLEWVKVTIKGYFDADVN